jgi:glutathione S-transferase
VQSWLDRQADKVARGLAVLEASPPKLDQAIEPLPNVGQITLACLLGYRDLRFAGTWRKDYPKLVAWHDKFAAQVPDFAATKFVA